MSSCGLEVTLGEAPSAQVPTGIQNMLNQQPSAMAGLSSQAAEVEGRLAPGNINFQMVMAASVEGRLADTWQKLAGALTALSATMTGFNTGFEAALAPFAPCFGPARAPFGRGSRSGQTLDIDSGACRMPRPSPPAMSTRLRPMRSPQPSKPQQRMWMPQPMWSPRPAWSPRPVAEAGPHRFDGVCGVAAAHALGADCGVVGPPRARCRPRGRQTSGFDLDHGLRVSGGAHAGGVGRIFSGARR